MEGSPSIVLSDEKKVESRAMNAAKSKKLVPMGLFNWNWEWWPTRGRWKMEEDGRWDRSGTFKTLEKQRFQTRSQPTCTFRMVMLMNRQPMLQRINRKTLSMNACAKLSASIAM